MSQAVNHLVGEYLAQEYPSVAKVFKKEAFSAAAPRRPPFGEKGLAEIVLTYRTEKPASRKASPKVAAKKAPIPDSSSDDDEPVKKPASRKASPKVAAKKTATDSDSSDDEEAPVKKSASTKPAARPVEDSDDDEVPKKKAFKTEAPARRSPHNLNDDGTYRRFQRIDPSKVTFHADVLRDNRPAEEHLTLRQNQEMMRTKGKGFNKLKQKNKGKFYGAGVDLTVRAYQFPDSDDE
ncbi:hypothetical protein ABB37_08063 [Leptomonas pyrrhocoris]|uniref:Srp40 C-terminal domain-containing protein n=1 Tax=Leptomonas pyrrhocoris TaxID=157538 RepID=A0A0M9FTY4_LEPPY|nr:hypothetical protein ABB37_08063 [Leptomonas pyrrhocoris]KPA75879.1 hypothetical protein ABB37_08063 [Leptomonas pyrrhocoris]|eukprot:XP_015654318.1 hypothetical protein ABB37_08063 [Leptomonas pyrrhocoris]